MFLCRDSCCAFWPPWWMAYCWMTMLKKKYWQGPCRYVYKAIWSHYKKFLQINSQIWDLSNHPFFSVSKIIRSRSSNWPCWVYTGIICTWFLAAVHLNRRGQQKSCLGITQFNSHKTMGIGAVQTKQCSPSERQELHRA